jgi:hypothetical protein
MLLYVIVNARSLALGLQPNPDAIIDWSDMFFSELLDVVHLARIGEASWLLIETFLRCHGFVREGVVPMNRRFQNTANRTDTSDELLGLAQDIAAGGDSTAWSDQELHDANVLQLPPGGRRYDDADAFPSDEWPVDLRNEIKELERKRILGLNYSTAEGRKMLSNREIIEAVTSGHSLKRGIVSTIRGPVTNL